MKTVLILSNHHAYTYNFRKEIIQELLDRGNTVYIVLPYGEKVELLKEMGCEFVNLPLYRRGMNPFKDFKLLFNYYKLMKRIEPDVVLSYTIKPNVYGGLATRLLNIPFIPNITGLGSAVENEGVLQKILVNLYKAAYKKAECVFFQNEENYNFFKQKNINIKRHEIIPGSGVNLNEFPFMEYPRPNGKLKFLFIGRIMKEKGIEELSEAAEIITNHNKNVVFEAVGFCEESYISKAGELGRLNAITFHGEQNDVKDYIKECNAVVLPSYHEGMANVLLEAASMGRPILASNIPGCKETFDETVTGFGFEPKNVDSLVKALQRFIDLPYDEKKNMGLLGRKKVELEFNRETVVSTYVKEIEQAISGGEII